VTAGSPRHNLASADLVPYLSLETRPEPSLTKLLGRVKQALADRYDVQIELGRGGMALVYLAEDIKHRRQVAIKVLRPEITGSIGAERFLREIEISARLSHPNILTLIDSGEADSLLFYVMPYVEGESLRDRMTRENQLPVDEALRITREIADALHYAHSKGIIHRDIKPENILLEAGHAVVADFGIARAVSEAGGTQLTKTGYAVGTPAYMSPEQALGHRDIDHRTDMYSLGCLLYEMLGGEPPYMGATPQAILARKAVDPVRSIRVVRAAVPESLEIAVTKALGRDPEDRYATVQEFAEALEQEPAPPILDRETLVRLVAYPPRLPEPRATTRSPSRFPSAPVHRRQTPWPRRARRCGARGGVGARDGAGCEARPAPAPREPRLRPVG
jgi:serine/threonine-protein kinase